MRGAAALLAGLLWVLLPYGDVDIVLHVVVDGCGCLLEFLPCGVHGEPQTLHRECGDGSG